MSSEPPDLLLFQQRVANKTIKHGIFGLENVSFYFYYVMIALRRRGLSMDQPGQREQKMATAQEIRLELWKC